MTPLLFLLLLFNLHYYNRTLANLYLGDHKISGLTFNELSQKIAILISDYEQQPVVLKVETPGGNSPQTYRLSLRDLGVEFDQDRTVNLVLKTGKSGNFPADTLAKLRSFLYKKSINPVYQINFSQLTTKLNETLNDHIKEPENATIVYDADIKIADEIMGQTYDMSQLVWALRNRLDNFASEPISTSILAQEPEIKSAAAIRARDKVQTLTRQIIVLNFEQDNWKLSGQKLFDLLEFYAVGRRQGFVSKFNFGQEALIINKINKQTPETSELEVGLNQELLSQFIEKIADSIDRATTDATLIFEGDKVIQFTPAIDGRLLDTQLTAEAIQSKVSIENISAAESIVINLPVKVTRAKIASEEINNLGIKELVGRGISYFGGSIPNRIHNIAQAAKRVNGTIIKSGDSFSFNRAVGEVSAATGYKQAYVITSGRTVLDDGGGICQVSTTIFRAALNSGLPIISRTAHAYRVGYYEQHGFTPGFDATVWAPAVDLVFKNDTGHHILVQTVIDYQSLMLEVDIYGTADGRRVEISQPVLSNFKDAPEDKYQEDPTLPRGTVKQVDFRADGLTSVFRRKVYKQRFSAHKNDELAIDETFKSNYRPWQAVYLVGTGE